MFNLQSWDHDQIKKSFLNIKMNALKMDPIVQILTISHWNSQFNKNINQKMKNKLNFICMCFDNAHQNSNATNFMVWTPCSSLTNMLGYSRPIGIDIHFKTYNWMILNDNEI
jgi:hypothetical protein